MSETKKNALSARRIRIISAVLAVLLVCAAGCAIFAAVAGPSGFFLRHTEVMHTHHHRVDAAMFSYYYYDLYHTALAERGAQYRAEGLDPALPPADQMRSDGQSWFDYFLGDAVEAVRRILVYAEAATLLGDDREASRSEADSAFAALVTAAEQQGMSLASYITARYGQGVGEDDVRRALELAAYAHERYRALAETAYTDEELENAYLRAPEDYRAVDYMIYTVKATRPSIPTEEALRDAYLAAEQAAKDIAAVESEEDFVSALAAHIRAKYTDFPTSRVEALVSDAYVWGARLDTGDELGRWLSDSRRTAGDTAVFGSNGDYRVVFFRAAHERLTYHRADMRDILFAFADYGTQREAREAAEALLGAFLDGDATEERFAAYAKSQSADAATAKNGGLYENIGYGDLEKNLTDWLLDPVRSIGDTALIRTDLGWHVVYFSGFAARSVWQEQAARALHEEAYRGYLDTAGLVVREHTLAGLPPVRVI